MLSQTSREQDILKEILSLKLDMKIIISSGYTDMDLTDPIFRSVHGFLHKPFTISELISVFHKLDG